MDKTEIIEIAAKLFAQKGYERTTMRDLARETNLTTAGLYYHIKNKIELLNEVEKWLFNELERKLFIENGSEKTPEERLRNFIAGYFDISLKRQELVAVISELGNIDPKFKEEIFNRRKRFIKKISRFVSSMTDDSKEDCLDNTLTAFILVAVVNWIPAWYNPDGRHSKKKMVDDITKFFKRALMI